MPTYQRATVHTSDDVRAIADHAGSHYFDVETMRFFDSRLLEGVWADALNTPNPPEWIAGLGTHAAREGNRFAFVTSERYDDTTPRLYSVRILTLTSRGDDDRPAVNIDTLGEFQGYATARDAKRAASAWAANVGTR